MNGPLSIGDNQTGSSANLNVGNAINRTASINISSALTTGVGQTISIGSAAITSGTQTINLGGSQTISGGGTQTININKPLTLNYNTSLTGNMNLLGCLQISSGSSTSLTSEQIKTITTVSNLPLGIYMVHYTINNYTFNSRCVCII